MVSPLTATAIVLFGLAGRKGQPAAGRHKIEPANAVSLAVE
jgi:hypothetical protein